MQVVFHGAAMQVMREGIEALIGTSHELLLVPDDLSADAAAAAAYRAADAIVGVRFDASLPMPRNLRLYQVAAAGYDRVDLDALPADAAVCNCFGHERAIAEYTMAALLAHRVPIAAADRDLRRGMWTYRAGGPHELRGELGDGTIAILGFGHIGKELAKYAKAFGMRTVVANRSPVEQSDLVDESFPLSRLEDAIRPADIVVNTLPLSGNTVGLIGERALAAMRSDALLVNVGRGPVVDEAALYAALKSRRIGGAVIDTWYVYPSADAPNPYPSHLPFHELDNVTMTPHMSGWTNGTVRRRREQIATNLHNLATGQPLAHRIR